MENRIIAQRIMNTSVSALEKAAKYYSILSVLNNIHITPREIDLLAYSVMNGPVSEESVKAGFQELFGSPPESTNNMITKLKKKGILIKTEDRGIIVNPKLVIDFNSPIVLNITMLHG